MMNETLEVGRTYEFVKTTDLTLQENMRSRNTLGNHSKLNFYKKTRILLLEIEDEHFVFQVLPARIKVVVRALKSDFDYSAVYLVEDII